LAAASGASVKIAHLPREERMRIEWEKWQQRRRDRGDFERER
jgi:hypothetical protein